MRKKAKKIDPVRKNSMGINPLRKKTARSFFFLNAILWFIYVIYIYYDMAVINNNKSSADIVTIFIFVNAIAMLVSGIIFGRQKKPTFY